MTATDHFVSANNINLHYIEYPDNGPAMLLMHGLTANAHAFGGLVAAGLANDFHLYSVDLRGRGQSDHPAFHYSMKDHARDIIEMLDKLQLKEVILCGHSFGGLLSIYIAANYPKRVSRLIILDAAARMNPRAGELLSYRLSTLDKVYSGWDEYLAEVKAAPYNNFWEDAMEEYYHADVRPAAKGGVTPSANLSNIIEASVGLASVAWGAEIEKVQQPALLINAPENYNLDEPLLPDDYARETAEALPNGTYLRVDGNHQTMLYGEGARQIVRAIRHFCLPEAIHLQPKVPGTAT
jgi:pimeloyl-ACP methyl ester carboxylesterase